MDELPPQDDLQALTGAAVDPYLSFEHLFKWTGQNRHSGSVAYIRNTHQGSQNRQMAMAAAAHGLVAACSLMAITFRNGTLILKAECHEMEDGEYVNSLEAGTLISHTALQNKQFWHDMVGYINESEALIQQTRPDRTGEATGKLIDMFNRYFEKYRDRLPQAESVVSKMID